MGESQVRDIIRLEHIYRSYGVRNTRISVLKDINLVVKEGEFVAVTGRSGSGKSTLMNIIGCLDRADEGKYFLDGIYVTDCREKEITEIRSRKIGFIFQGFNLIPSMNALENAALPLMYRGVGKREREYAAYHALEMVGMSHRKDHLPGEMSGGQQQRTAIARAIAASPPLLLCDEPTGSLDKTSGEEVLSIIENMNNKGATVVMITHDPEIAMRAKRRISISDGKILEE